MQIKTMVMC